MRDKHVLKNWNSLKWRYLWISEIQVNYGPGASLFDKHHHRQIFTDQSSRSINISLAHISVTCTCRYTGQALNYRAYHIWFNVCLVHWLWIVYKILTDYWDQCAHAHVHVRSTLYDHYTHTHTHTHTHTLSLIYMHVDSYNVYCVW